MAAEIITYKICFRCKAQKPINTFAPSKYNKDGRISYCPPCRRAQCREAEARRIQARGAPTIPPVKFCTNCRETKPSAGFHRNRRASDGLADYCKPCCAAHYRQKHPVGTSSLPNEQWKKVPGLTRYSVSNLGRVRTDISIAGNPIGRVMTLQISRAGKGYFTAGLTKNGRKCTYQVHRLVAAAFLKADDRSLPINHKDGNTRNNLPSNLEYVTPAQNSRHARSVLKAGAHKLTEDCIRAIRTRARGGERHHNIAADFRLATSTVTRIVNRLSWAHVD